MNNRINKEERAANHGFKDKNGKVQVLTHSDLIKMACVMDKLFDDEDEDTELFLSCKQWDALENVAILVNRLLRESNPDDDIAIGDS